MPRTKRNKLTNNKVAADKALLLKTLENQKNALLNELDTEDLKIANLEMEHDLIMNIMRESLRDCMDVRLKDLDSFHLSLIGSSRKPRGRPKLKRSLSDADARQLLSASKASTVRGDSGSSSSSGVSGPSYRSGQQSGSSNRAKPAVSAQKTRRSRSLSRNLRSGFPVDCGSARSTVRKPFGYKTSAVTPITPKMKDYNAHPAIMRRPKQNEIAVSLQGSPLMVNAVMTDGINANIPLPDGRVIALQPQNMRYSEIADITLGPDSIHELQQLRDNLTKLCQNYKKSRYNKH